MSCSVFAVVNQVALIYGRPLLEQPVVDLYRQATGIRKDEDFVRCLLVLLQTSKTFPVPADFEVFAVTYADRQEVGRG